MARPRIIEPYNTELSQQGLRILARMVARHQLEKKIAIKRKNDSLP